MYDERINTGIYLDMQESRFKRPASDTAAGGKMSIQRFLTAQENIYETALEEIKNGRKRSHWIWYIFPQIEGLGFSTSSRKDAISGLPEAREYLDDPVLKERLIEISKVLIELPEYDPMKVMGYPDNLKLCSSMTLFHVADSEEPVFSLVLDKFFDGKKDENTMRILKDRGNI